MKKVEEESPQEIREAIHKILVHIGEDPNRQGLQETPDRMIRS